MSTNLSPAQIRTLASIAERPRGRAGSRLRVTDDSLVARGLVEFRKVPLTPSSTLKVNLLHVTEAGRAVLAEVKA